MMWMWSFLFAFLWLSDITQCTSTATFEPLPFGLRVPPGFNIDLNNNQNSTKEDCQIGRICAGLRHDHYPIGHTPGVLLSSRFVVPPYPKEFDPTKTTYYDYFNIFFRKHPTGGFFNQFVPQLHLGNALANSTNAPHYHPIWEILDEWHIGAQYFFALLCNQTSNDDYYDADKKPCWKAHAATGKLIRVVPGEVIETIFELVEISKNDWEWHLRMGVAGGHPSRRSVVVVRQPYMGILDPNSNWQDDHYINVTVGSCLENYGMVKRDNYPQAWEIEMDIILPQQQQQRRQQRLARKKQRQQRRLGGGDIDAPVGKQQQQQQQQGQRQQKQEQLIIDWDDWVSIGGGEQPDKCSWLPHCTIKNVQGYTWQRATWNATLLPPQKQKQKQTLPTSSTITKE